ncbi:MAG: hypothetical protein HQL51_12700 [Magnetococcales bacterium]|nr:hypothetical protein [Magnetococcales bacterium]
MSLPTFEEAQQAEGQTLKLTHPEGGVLEVTVTKVESKGKTPDFFGKVRDPFTIFFSGVHDDHCPQGVYTLHRENADPWEFFIVPIAKNGATNEVTYQAVFN